MSDGQYPVPRSLQRLQDLLLYPGEDLDKEYKDWLDLSSERDRANLAKALLAIANHGGGYVILGYVQKEGKLEANLPAPSDRLKHYSQDVVNSIVDKYAKPPFHCKFSLIPYPQTAECFPMIEVPGDQKVPIRAKRDGPNGEHVQRNTYYIRRQGPKSESPQRSDEWEALIGRCVRKAREELVSHFRNIVYGIGPQMEGPSAGATEPEKIKRWISEGRERWADLVGEKLSAERPSRYQHGTWTFSYLITGDLTIPDFSQLESVLKRVEGHETGWPVWWVPDLSYTVEPPYPRNGILECWLKDARPPDSAHSDFWRASPEGKMFLLRGYQEDSTPDKVSPGKYLWAETPIWGVGECLLHARRLSAILGDEEAEITFSCSWEGLAGRTLRYWNAEKDEETWFDQTKRTCHQRSVESPLLTVSSKDVEPNLPEIIKDVTKVLYQAFRFYEPEMNLFQRETAKIRKRG